MKKLGTLILALALALTVCTPALAANTDSGSTTLTTTVGTNYVVVFPPDTPITYGATSTALSKIYLTTANFAAGESVSVSLTASSGTVNTKKLTSGSNEIAYSIQSGSPPADFSSGTLADLDDEIVLTIGITQAAWNAAPAGNYSGTISFTVALNQPTP